jgi:hypothetical protein
MRLSRLTDWWCCPFIRYYGTDILLRIDKNPVIYIILLITVLFVVFTLRQLTIGPPEIDAEHAFNTERGFSRLVRILGNEAPHPVDSLPNDGVRERLLTEIRSLGFSPILRDDFHCNNVWRTMRCARVQNIMFWVGDQGPNAVMIASHYDSVPAGPGASDDGAGVAASLEIASVLKNKPLKRPVLVLITDGEEVGLIGAAAFVDKDPMAKLVSAVVSMEARGVNGPVVMIQTSTPNSDDVSALKSDIKMSSTSSLVTDVYQRMPNGTDVTQFLKLDDIDANNFAIGGSPELYHTPRDNLAMLDKRSFFHMGATALNTVEALLEQSGDEREQQWLYADVFGLFMVTFPLFIGLPLIVFGGLVAFAAFLLKGSGSQVRSLAYPFIALIMGAGLALMATFLVDAMRTELHYTAAHPWALRAAQNSAALLGAVVALMLLGRSISSSRLQMSSWLWLALLGGCVSFFFPGAAIYFFPALAAHTLACLLLFLGMGRSALLLSVLSALLFSVLIIPTLALIEIMLFVENMAPFSIFLVFCFVLFVPHALPTSGFQEKLTWKVPAAGLCILVCFLTLAIIIPAYSPEAPRSLSISHAVDSESGEAKFSVFTHDPLPDAMRNVTPFSRGSVAGFERQAYVAKAPRFETQGVNIRVDRNEIVANERLLEVNISAPDSDIIMGRIKERGVSLNSLTLNGNTQSQSNTQINQFQCHGRSCRSLTLSFAVSSNEPSVTLQVNGFRYGLGDEGRALLLARPEDALPKNLGDTRILSTTVKLK